MKRMSYDCAAGSRRVQDRYRVGFAGTCRAERFVARMKIDFLPSPPDPETDFANIASLTRTTTPKLPDRACFTCARPALPKPTGPGGLPQ